MTLHFTVSVAVKVSEGGEIQGDGLGGRMPKRVPFPNTNTKFAAK
jgi:hypothetical protein